MELCIAAYKAPPAAGAGHKKPGSLLGSEAQWARGAEEGPKLASLRTAYDFKSS